MGTAVQSVKALVVRALTASNISLKPFLVSQLVSLLLLGEDSTPDEAGAKKKEEKVSGFFGQVHFTSPLYPLSFVLSSNITHTHNHSRRYHLKRSTGFDSSRASFHFFSKCFIQAAHTGTPAAPATPDTDFEEAPPCPAAEAAWAAVYECLHLVRTEVQRHAGLRLRRLPSVLYGTWQSQESPVCEDVPLAHHGTYTVSLLSACGPLPCCPSLTVPSRTL
jgi:hypothetical protein